MSVSSSVSDFYVFDFLPPRPPGHLFRFSAEPSRDRNELFMIDHQATSFAFQQSHSGTGTNCS